MDRAAWQAIVHEVTKSQTQLREFHSLTQTYVKYKSVCKYIHCNITCIYIYNIYYRLFLLRFYCFISNLEH